MANMQKKCIYIFVTCLTKWGVFFLKDLAHTQKFLDTKHACGRKIQFVITQAMTEYVVGQNMAIWLAFFCFMLNMTFEIHTQITLIVEDI